MFNFTIMREICTETPMRYYFMPINTDKNIKLNNIKCW